MIEMDIIVKLFVDAGYFRARISSLSDFDKIIGGMAWAMQVFSHDINIDIFYKDSLDLGQKIALTERIVMVLIAVNCPHSIEPHQIVGLDYTNLFPVLRWLIKRSEEIRAEHEAFNRLLALRHYHRITNTMPERTTWCHLIPLSRLHQLESQRDPQIRDATAPGGSVGGPSPTDDLDNTDELIRRIQKEFKDNQQVSFIKLPGLFRAKTENAPGNEDRSVENDDQGNESDDSIMVEDDRSRGHDESSHDRKNGPFCMNYQLDMKDDALPAAVGTNETHGEQETGMVTKVQDQNSMLDFEIQRPPMSAEEQLMHRELDTELLATNQKILNLLKKLDSIPRDLEIIQYQRRYVELHQQLIGKNRDVKKIYDLYNSLDIRRHYLSKQINLLDSIAANFDLTNNSATNRDLFMRQFEDIIGKIVNIRDSMLSKLDLVRDEYKKILDKVLNELD